MATDQSARLAELQNMMRQAMGNRADMDGALRYGAPGSGYFVYGEEHLDFLPAPDLAIIAGRLIEQYDELYHLDGTQIIYLWKAKGGVNKGSANLGYCQKTSGLVKYFASVPWVIWLAADHVFSYDMTRRQVEALLYHELLHAGEEENEDGNKKVTVIGHDFEGFANEVKRYGDWHSGLTLCKKAWEQPSLFDAVVGLTPKPWSGIESVTLSSGDKGVTLTPESGRQEQQNFKDRVGDLLQEALGPNVTVDRETGEIRPNE